METIELKEMVDFTAPNGADYKGYTRAALRTLSMHSTLQDTNTHMLMGMMTEIGEIADILKKEHAYKKPIDKVHLNEEVGDLFWYLMIFCYVNGIDVPECWKINIKKLKARYPEKFTTDRALNRDLTKELNALNTLNKNHNEA